MERIPTGKKDKPLTEIKLTHLTIHANPLAEDDTVYLSATGPPSRVA